MTVARNVSGKFKKRKEEEKKKKKNWCFILTTRNVRSRMKR